MRIRLIRSLAFSMFAILGACAPPKHQPLDQDQARVRREGHGINILSRVGPDGTLLVDGALPTFSSLLTFDARTIGTDAEGKPIVKALPRVDSVGGGASHEMVIPISEQWAALRSATVFKVTVDEFVRDADGTTTLKGLTIGSDSAEANRSVADVAKALEPTWRAWSEDQRAQYVEFIQTGRALGLAGFDTVSKALDVLKTIPLP